MNRSDAGAVKHTRPAAKPAALALTVTAGVASVLRWSLVASLTVMLGCVALQVFTRHVLGSPPPWAEEVAVLMFSWSAMGALALGVREGFHVRMTVHRLLPEPLRQFWERVILVLMGAFGTYFAWAGWRFVEFTAGGHSAAARYPIELLHAMAPLCGGLAAIFALEGALAGTAHKCRRGQGE